MMILKKFSQLINLIYDISNIYYIQFHRIYLSLKYRVIMSLSALATPFVPASQVSTSSPPSSVPTSPRGGDNRGYILMERMGWSPGTPLGIRGIGITSPIEVPYRHEADRRGLGFGVLDTEEDEVRNVSMKIKRIFPNYNGVAVSDYGDIYIPNSSLRHIKNVAKLSTSLQLPDIYVKGNITKTDKKIKWRLEKVVDVQGYLHQFASNFEWGEPYIQ